MPTEIKTIDVNWQVGDKGEVHGLAGATYFEVGTTYWWYSRLLGDYYVR